MCSLFICSPKITHPHPQVSRLTVQYNLQPAALLMSFGHQRFNNPPQTALLTSSVQYDKIISKFGQQQLVMVNYVCGLNQSETETKVKNFKPCYRYRNKFLITLRLKICHKEHNINVLLLFIAEN